MNDLSEMIIHTTEDGLTKVNVNFDGDTVWLTQEQMSELFQKAKSTINDIINKSKIFSPPFHSDVLIAFSVQATVKD